MTRLPTGRLGQTIAVLLLFLVLATTWTAVAAPLLSWYTDRAEALGLRAGLEQRIAAIAAGLSDLQRQAAAVAKSGTPSMAVLDGTSDAIAGAALQQRLQDIAAAAGTTLVSTEAVPSEQRGAYRQIGVRLAVNAPWPVLIQLLLAIEEASPQMLVDDLQVHGGRGFIRDAAGPLDASMTVSGFRAGAAGP